MLDYRTDTFITLYKEMNYRKTAEMLRMTQPGVTQHIHYLESHYGIKLFEYDGRQLHRTKHADALKKHLDSVMAQEKAMMEGFAQPEQVHLDVGATKTIGEFVLAPVLNRFLMRPEHSIHFEINNTQILLGMLEDSMLDFAVIEGVFDKQRYGHHLFKRERFLGICGRNHPFAGCRVTLDEVFRQTLVVREPGSGTRRILEQAIAERGYTLDAFPHCISVSNFSVIAGAVAQSGAITFGYAPVAAHREDLSTFEVADMDISGEFNFVYCNETTARRKIDLFFGEDA